MTLVFVSPSELRDSKKKASMQLPLADFLDLVYSQHREHFLKKKEQHFKKVALMAAKIAKEMRYSVRRWVTIGVIGLFHDIGKGYEEISHFFTAEWVPFRKKKRLLEYVRDQHQVHAADMLARIPNLGHFEDMRELILTVASHHHDNWDDWLGPDGKSKLPIEVWIVAVADAWVGMTEGRPYVTDDARKALIDGAKNGKFCPKVVKAMFSVLAKQPRMEKASRKEETRA